MGIFHWRAFGLLLACAQVLTPAQYVYYFKTIPARLDSFTFSDAVWSFIYFETMAIIFALLSCILVAFYESIQRKEYKAEKQ